MSRRTLSRVWRFWRGAAFSVFGLTLLHGAATTNAYAQAATAPITFRVYRAIDSRLLGGSLGDAGTRLGNTNAGSAGGVLGYLHTEVVPSFARDFYNGPARFNDIDAIAVFEVRVLNVRRARLQRSNDPPTTDQTFGPYMAFNRGVAAPPQAREFIEMFGAYVGVQDQRRNARHQYPGDWYSFVGGCPLSAWETRADGTRGKPIPCPTQPDLEGICEKSSAEAPDGTPLCQYTYSYLGYVRIDDLVGITSKKEPLCRDGKKKRPCVDFADFHRNGGVEYDGGAPNAMKCIELHSPESGLPFWRGRCDPTKAAARIDALTNWKNLVPPSPSIKK